MGEPQRFLYEVMKNMHVVGLNERPLRKNGILFKSQRQLLKKKKSHIERMTFFLFLLLDPIVLNYAVQVIDVASW